MKRVLQITLIFIIPSFVFYYGWSATKRSGMKKEQYYARIKKGTLKGWYDIERPELRNAQIRLTEKYARFAALLGIPQRFFMNQRFQEAIPTLAKITEAVDYYLLLQYGHDNGVYTSADEVINQFRARWPENTAAYLRLSSSHHSLSHGHCLPWTHI